MNSFGAEPQIEEEEQSGVPDVQVAAKTGEMSITPIVSTAKENHLIKWTFIQGGTSKRKHLMKKSGKFSVIYS